MRSASSPGQQCVDQQNSSAGINSAQPAGGGQQPMNADQQSQQSVNSGGQPMAGNQTPASQSSAGGQPTYSIPGIVHYLQYEWQRFEMQRQQWEV